MKGRKKKVKPKRKIRWQYLKQKAIWFLEGFCISCMCILFFSGFFWVSTGSGNTVSLEQPVIQAGVRVDERVGQEKISIIVMGNTYSIPVEKIGNVITAIKKYKVLIPPGIRMLIDWTGVFVYGVKV